MGFSDPVLISLIKLSRFYLERAYGEQPDDQAVFNLLEDLKSVLREEDKFDPSPLKKDLNSTEKSAQKDLEEVDLEEFVEEEKELEKRSKGGIYLP